MEIRTGFLNAMGLDPTKQRIFVEVEPNAFVLVDKLPTQEELDKLIKEESDHRRSPKRIRFHERAFNIGIIHDWHNITPDLFKETKWQPHK